MTKYYSPKEAIKETNIGRNEMYRLCRSEDLWRFGHKEGSRYKIDLKKLEKYLERRTKWQY